MKGTKREPVVVKRYVGIDPGNEGAIALIEERNEALFVTEVNDMPTFVTEGKGKTKKGNIKKHTVLDEQKLRGLLKELFIDHAFIEKSQSMPGQGAPATFNYALGYGIIRGICIGLGIPYTLIHPATWKNKMMKDMDKGKDAAIVRASQLYPTAMIGKKDGRAEAILIAHYGIKEKLF